MKITRVFAYGYKVELKASVVYGDGCIEIESDEDSVENSMDIIETIRKPIAKRYNVFDKRVVFTFLTELYKG